MKKEDIRKMVREVLQEKGLRDSPARASTSRRITRPCPFPAVLNVFHPGVRYLEAALEQVRQIEALAGKSSVFTVQSARDWVCGRDVQEKSGCKCILDTVKPQGIEKALHKADILVLPTFCFKTASKVARLINDSQETAIVIAALMQSKPVLAASDGFTLLDTLSNPVIGEEIKRILGILENFGMVFSETGQLAAEFEKITAANKQNPSLKAGPADPARPVDAHRLITVKEIRLAVDNHQETIELAPGGLVTPLAKDQAKEYAVKIVRAGAKPALSEI